MATSTRRVESLHRSPKHFQQHIVHHPRRAHLHQDRHNNSTTANLDANSVAAKHAHVIATQIKTRNSQNILQQPSPPRMKRPLDPIANNYEPHKAKRTRITVEIVARPIPPSTSSQKTITVRTQPQQQQPPNPTTINEPPTTTTTTSTAVTTTQKSHKLPHVPHQDSKTATAIEPPLKKHKAKAINGIRHELDKLQPSAADTSSARERPGRKLRSQEATRFKSELSAYFPDYDEVIGNDPKEQHILNLDTPIIIVDTHPLPSTYIRQSQAPIPSPHPALGSCDQPRCDTVRTYGDHLFNNLHDAQRISFAFLQTRYNGKDIGDPLPASYFESAHKKAERLEKSIRNTEKGRAQHEKDQIIRLLNELQGHDWLRTMGVSGVTESRKKTFEPARDHFIKGCQVILEKFRVWSQEEKKRKLMKEKALAEEAENEEEVDEDEGAQLDEVGETDEDISMVDVNEEGNDIPDDVSNGDPPDYSDVDASAKQLLDEALARAKYTASSSKRSRGEPPPISAEPRVTKEFTSFFNKKHLRDAALSKGRRRGRTVVAWGHPIPDMMEGEFELPEEYRDMEILKAHERQKRRERRQRQH
ncbi:something about silencing, SAS, complex subunit 4-domain-containing protein [Annulohypoxylon maeteangense]|uniref:something about silencing, SAS, complex subunit 4-domain-containing protein n=1 Tax=Annulohypoxylon maeteangense TaxID=1927788 RepID=UPI0020083C98|nr:something about silencing, SAS, complex subunit 4-domain-containing protein [Annulohypoxylon maeteangense]KAI0882218.1 something about silencing, SAS, complex subunit 4-domain-containing protein [Annulohypoxylon maeteangense]